MKITPPILVFPANSTSFNSNGIRCLSPTLCEVDLKENEAHSLHMEHPCDDDGAWRNLVIDNLLWTPVPERNIVRWQPLRIYKIVKKRNSNGTRSISVDAKHDFYDLNNVLLTDVRPTQLNGQNALNWIFSKAYKPNVQPTGKFVFKSDIPELKTAYYENKTMTEALIGTDNSFVNVWGGELYISGHYFSINKRKENSRDNAFKLAYSYNVESITATYDASSVNTILYAKNQKTGEVIVKKGTDLSPFPRTIYHSFSYDDTNVGNFRSDVDKYFSDISKVKVSYSVNLAELRNTEEYADFEILDSCEVGDTGLIYDSDLGIETTQKIIGKKVDVLTQETKSLELGMAMASITDVKRITATSDLEKRIENLEYQQIEFIDFSISPSLPYILGQTVDIKLSWELSKFPKVQKLNGVEIEGNQAEFKGITSSQTYTLEVSDDKSTISKTINAEFVNYILHGTGAASVSLASLQKIASDEKARKIHENASEGKYIFYAYPVRLGEAKFFVNGIEGGFDNPLIVSYKNAFNFTENYYVYKSSQANLGETEVEVR